VTIFAYLLIGLFIFLCVGCCVDYWHYEKSCRSTPDD